MSMWHALNIFSRPRRHRSLGQRQVQAGSKFGYGGGPPALQCLVSCPIETTTIVPRGLLQLAFSDYDIVVPLRKSSFCTGGSAALCHPATHATYATALLRVQDDQKQKLKNKRVRALEAQSDLGATLLKVGSPVGVIFSLRRRRAGTLF
jgi:hypothetical protein